MKKTRKNLFTYSLNHLFPSKPAFTLAEVLITLGIIGVVAAITIPTLIANINGKKFASQYKKTLSSINQAVRMAEAKYDFNFANIGSYGNMGDVNDSPENVISMFSFVNGTLKGIQAFASYPSNNYSDHDTEFNCSHCKDDPHGIIVEMADGSLFNLHMYNVGDCTMMGKTDIYEIADSCTGFIDVNGYAPPNKEVQCADGDTGIISGTCIVKSKGMGDIFPIIFYDGTAVPATNAARSVLQNAK